MSEIRVFKCQQCGYEKALDTVFNFEVCPRCSGNFFPVDYKPEPDWKARAEKAEAKNKRLREALAWYADERNYNGPSIYTTEIESDRGANARLALKGGE